MTGVSSKILVAIAALVGAYLAASASVASSLARANPAVASMMPIAQGPALARATRVQLARSLSAAASGGTGMAAGLQANITSETRDLALKAFFREPLETDAILALGLSLPPTRDDARKRNLFGQLHQLSRRNEAAALWLAQDAARRNDIPGTLGHFDEVLRTSRESRAAILAQFALATADPRFREGMVTLMAANPPWATDYWVAGASVPQAAIALGELRLALAGKGVPFDSGADQKIANSLLAQGQFDLAAKLYASAAGRRAQQSVVRNDSFDRPSFMPPIDWEMYSTGELGSEIATDDGIMLAYASSYPGGGVARQWVRLGAGAYRLDVTARIFPGTDGDRMMMSLTCMAGSASGERTEISISEGRTSQRIEPAGSCRDYWLDVHLIPAERSPGVEAEIEAISLTPIEA